MISLSDRVLLMATGEIECPGTEGPASLRWNWLADMYSHPVWGLVTIPGFSVSVGCEIAMLCRDMPTGTVNSLATRWDAVHRLGAIGASRAQSAALYAWSAVADTTVDAHDYLSGHQFSGAEAVAAAFWAHLAAKPGSVAEACVAAAIEAWDLRLHRPSTRGAVA
ncbi:hypothetical protein [Rhodococcus sp. IEGM 1307]|uniref:hypothetical protein n=1 Tax=Rhodococcus sp. IEGM 1307 TaxID=3047091 RepID=UPI00076A4D12|nr:hypothetical protein [Rhodococcus sp. IEGM 1307]KXF51900.1 hypothetical protein AXA44_12440 [Rhodococcus sp. SC4]MDI9979767.1 hypothetical protein [Rhodococcus sp. IEGM 1307]RZK93858.1 MAG: hypothetical protein EOP30_09510 [Rhodococcus sp. (in: high G+C Gram-positive bacteria)]